MTTLKYCITLLVVGGVAAGCIDLPEVENSIPDSGYLGGGGAGPDAGDTTPPSLLSTVPADGTNAVAVTSGLQVTFSEPMRPSSVRLSLQPAVALEPPEWSAGNTRVTVQPATALSQSTTYTVLVEGLDEAGNSLAGTQAFSFRTDGPEPDTTRPTVVNFSPGDSELGVDRSGAVIVLFSEPMNKASVESAFAIVSPLGFNTGTFSWNAPGTEMTFRPSASFDYGADVRWKVSATAKDISGNTLQTEVAGAFRAVRLYTVSIDFDPYTSGSLGKPGYYRSHSTYDIASIGDDDTNQSHRLFLGFRLDSLPEDTRRINSANLKWWVSSQLGAPFANLGNLLIERVDIGNNLDGSSTIDGPINPLAAEDYHASTTDTPITTTTIALAPNPTTFNITTFATRDWNERESRRRRTQYRLRFEIETNQNNSSDTLRSTSETNPKLAELHITYEAP